jgi:hypothetical protein
MAKRGKVVVHTEKGSRLELLPNRHALNKISGGDPERRTINDYSKAGPGIASASPDIIQTGDNIIGAESIATKKI